MTPEDAYNYPYIGFVQKLIENYKSNTGLDQYDLEHSVCRQAFVEEKLQELLELIPNSQYLDADQIDALRLTIELNAFYPEGLSK